MGIWRDACLLAASALSQRNESLRGFTSSLLAESPRIAKAIEARNALAHQPARDTAAIAGHSDQMSDTLGRLLVLWKEAALTLMLVPAAGDVRERSTFVYGDGRVKVSSYPWCFVQESERALVLPRRHVRAAERVHADVFVLGMVTTRIVTVP
jgi:hypothetical protein